MTKTMSLNDEQLFELIRNADPLAQSSPPTVAEIETALRRAAALAHASGLNKQADGGARSGCSGRGPSSRFPRSRSRLLVLGGGTGTLAAGAVVAVLVLTAGGEPSVAFAGWTGDPTAPAGGQVQAAESSCHRAPSLPSDLASAAPSLVDTRGPYTMLVYANSTSSGLCITGVNGPNYLPPVSGISVTDATAVAPDAIHPGVDGQGFTRASLPQAAFSWTAGRVGQDVTAVTLVLEDGTSVEATTANGWYAAWWPAGESAQTADITTTTGTTTQQLIPAAALGGTGQSRGASSPNGNTASTGSTASTSTP